MIKKLALAAVGAIGLASPAYVAAIRVATARIRSPRPYKKLLSIYPASQGWLISIRHILFSQHGRLPYLYINMPIA